MKLTGELKKQVAKAETRKEAKEAIENAGMLLTDDELDQVSGGWWFYGGDTSNVPDGLECEDCGYKFTNTVSSKSCPKCGGKNIHVVER